MNQFIFDKIVGKNNDNFYRNFEYNEIGMLIYFENRHFYGYSLSWEDNKVKITKGFSEFEKLYQKILKNIDLSIFDKVEYVDL